MLIIIVLIIAGALPWIGMLFDMILHPFNVQGPLSRFGRPFIVSSILMFALGIILLLVGV